MLRPRRAREYRLRGDKFEEALEPIVILGRNDRTQPCLRLVTRREALEAQDCENQLRQHDHLAAREQTASCERHSVSRQCEVPQGGGRSEFMPSARTADRLPSARV